MYSTFIKSLLVSANQDTTSLYNLALCYFPNLSKEDFLSNLEKESKLIFSFENLNSAKHLKKLRSYLLENSIDAFIFSTTDEYINEYPPLCANRLHYLSGFNGSLGFCIVLANSACIFVDHRYTLQLEQQTDPALFSRGKLSFEDMSNFLKINLSTHHKITADITENSTQNIPKNIALDPKIFTKAQVIKFQTLASKLNASLVMLEKNPIDETWKNRPLPPISPVFLHEEKYTGQSYQEKIIAIAKTLVANNLDYFLCTSPDNIAWLLNIRAADVAHNPVVLCYALIHKSANVVVFINRLKLTPAIIQSFTSLASLNASIVDSTTSITSATVSFVDEKNLESTLKTLLQDKTIGISNAAPYYFSLFLDKHNLAIQELTDPITTLKTLKNPKEIANLKVAHQRDGAKLIELMHYLDNRLLDTKNLANNPENEILDEVAISTKLENIRAKDLIYRGSSFESIVAIDANAALPHYRPALKTTKVLTPNSKLLLDCGAQYLEGTTDVTRTFTFTEVNSVTGSNSLGEANSRDTEFKKCFTYILKGHIALSSIKFPKGTTGGALDVLARQFLWEQGLNYGHGTGHGVGFFLSVHEGPISISPNNQTPLQVGMLISNEPGFYKNNDFGIRLENLILVVESTLADFLEFEPVTLVPFDTKNLDLTLLSPKELLWINNYHQRVLQELSPHLNTDLIAYLKEKTTAIVVN